MDFVLNLAVSLVAQAKATSGSATAIEKARLAHALLDGALTSTSVDPRERARRAALHEPTSHRRERARVLAGGC